MVWEFIDVFKNVANSNRVHDDDFSDRLNHRWTVALLLFFCILVGSKQFVGDPIGCWAPAQFTDSMTDYANSVCWIANTYYVPIDDSLPKPTESRLKINYYQWVPFILALMAFLFYFPFTVWHVLLKPNGLDAKIVLEIISGMNASSSSESRDKMMQKVAVFIDRIINYSRDYNETSGFGRMRRRITRCFLPTNRSGYYIIWLYIGVKILYAINVFSQFFLLNAFMGPKFNLFGFEVIHNWIRGRDFWESSRFPRVTMCDFSIRNLGENNHRNTIQCTLQINLFNEKIFM